jgi:hypothetical protein
MHELDRRMRASGFGASRREVDPSSPSLTGSQVRFGARTNKARKDVDNPEFKLDDYVYVSLEPEDSD